MTTAHPIALSTMWAQQDRFASNPRAFAEAARDLGFTHIEISYVMPPDAVAILALGDVLPVSSLHQPAPRVDHAGRWNHDLNLASLDEDERTAAVGYALETIRIAGEASARAVVIHLGAVAGGLMEEERALRDGFGALPEADAHDVRGRLATRRAAAVPPHMVAARRSLDTLVSAARKGGVVIGLEDRLHYHEIPSLEETEALLREYEPSVLGYWHDTGHAEVLHRLGLGYRDAWLERLGARTVGSHLHDVAGLVDHRAPGEGDMPWEGIAAGLPPVAIRVFEINQHRPAEAIARGIELLAARGVV
jgi:sugar phosphate isomerase/epimerase